MLVVVTGEEKLSYTYIVTENEKLFILYLIYTQPFSKRQWY